MPPSPAFSLDHLDRSMDPTRDFFRFASGSWIDRHPIPDNKTRWGAFDELQERNFRFVRALLEEARSGRPGRANDPKRKVGDFFAAATDRPRRTLLGARPIAADLRRVASISGTSGVLREIARTHRQGGPTVFSNWVQPDEKESGRYALYLYQGGLALPDRDYYLTPAFAKVRRQYKAHIERLLRLAGDRPEAARAAARDVLRIETELARRSRSRVDLRDPIKNYQRFTIAELTARHPNLGWRSYFRTQSRRKLPFVVVGQPEFFDALNEMVGSFPLPAWKRYLRWQVVHDAAPELSPLLEAEDFRFFHRELLGQKEPEPEWKRAAIRIDRSIGEALGRLFVERHFPPATRARMLELVNDLVDVVRRRLGQVPWMTEATRAKALAKFARFTAHIGHPESFRTYAKVRVSRSDHLGNMRRARAAEAARELDRVGRAVDRDEWLMTPPTVNAHFVPTLNEIFFPAGILQPPFFDPAMDDAVNFGAIAVVIGHEITHGFDDQGRQFDADGNLQDWWSERDADEFKRRAQRIIEEYNGFEPLPGLHLNGELTQGENIADLGGVSLAFEALTRRISDGRTPGTPIDGYTPQQRFFLSYGQIWRMNVRPEETRRRVTIDPHSPGRFRVNGVVSNLPEFWAAFGVPEGSPMRQDEAHRVEIW